MRLELVDFAQNQFLAKLRFQVAFLVFGVELIFRCLKRLFEKRGRHEK